MFSELFYIQRIEEKIGKKMDLFEVSWKKMRRKEILKEREARRERHLSFH